MVAVLPAPPKLGFTPSSYDYGEVTAGQAASQAFTLVNTGATASGTLAVRCRHRRGSPRAATPAPGPAWGRAQSCTVKRAALPGQLCPCQRHLDRGLEGPPPCPQPRPPLRSPVAGWATFTGRTTRRAGDSPRARSSWPTAMAPASGSCSRPGRAERGGGRRRPPVLGHQQQRLRAGNGAIHRANLDGSDPQTIATGQSLGESPGGGLAVDASYVYWTADNGTIWRANHDGTGANVIATWESGPAGVAVDGGFIYWGADFDNGTIWRAVDGGNPKLIATGQVHPVGVAVDASHVYWANLDNGEIIQASLDGSNAKPVATGQNHPLGVAVDGDHLYWAVWFDNTIVQAGLDGSNPRLVASGQNTPTGLAVGWWVSVPRFLYLASFGGGHLRGQPERQQPAPPGRRSERTRLQWRSTPATSTGRPRTTSRTGAARSPGPGRERPAAHRHRVRQPDGGGGRRQLRLLDHGRRRPQLLARSTGPAWMAAARRPSSPGWRTSRAWWRSVPAASTGPGQADGSAGSGAIWRPAWSAAARRPSSEARTDQWGWRSMAGYLYWANTGETPNSGTISRAGLDGSDPQVIVTGQDFPYGVAVDANYLYWVNRGDDTVDLANLDGSDPQTLGSGQGAWGLAVSPVVRVV